MERLEVVEFDYRNKEDLKSISELHGKVLPGSNVPGLGKLFMEHFYYTTLCEKGLLKCYLAKYDDKIVGLLATTKWPYSFIKKGIKGQYLKVMFILGLSVLLKPSRLKAIISQMKYKADPILKEYEESGTSFELLTIGVLDEFRSLVLPENKKIANKMADAAFKYYKEQGFKYATGQIVKENTAPLKFWGRNYKGKFHDSSVKSTSCILVIDLNEI